MSTPENVATAFGIFSTTSGNEILVGEFVEIDEAICWVAFNQFQTPALGRRPVHEFLIHADYASWLDEQADQDEQAFKIAREQVFNAIENGHLPLVGKESERENDDPEIVPLRPFITHVTPQMLAEGGWIEQARSYGVGELQFDGLFVPFADLERLFGPFKKSSAGKTGNYRLDVPR